VCVCVCVCVCARARACVRVRACIHTQTILYMKQKPDVAKEMGTDVLRSDFITCRQLTMIWTAEQRHTILQVQSISEVEADRQEAGIQNLFPY